MIGESAAPARVEHIQAGDDVTAAQPGQERVAVDPAPRDTLTNTLPGRSQASSLAPIIRSCRASGAQREHHVAIHHRGQRAEGYPVRAGQLPRHERIEGHDIDVEGPEQLGQPPGEVAEANHSDTLAAELGPVVTRARSRPDAAGEGGPWAMIRRNSAPALRRPIKARASPHSAVGHDDACEVSMTSRPAARPLRPG